MFDDSVGLLILVSFHGANIFFVLFIMCCIVNRLIVTHISLLRIWVLQVPPTGLVLLLLA